MAPRCHSPHSAQLSACHPPHIYARLSAELGARGSGLGARGSGLGAWGLGLGAWGLGLGAWGSPSITPRTWVNRRLLLCSKGEKPFNSDGCITNFMDLDGPAEAGSVRWPSAPVGPEYSWMVKGARWRRQSGAAASLTETSRSPAPAARYEGCTLDGCSRQPRGFAHAPCGCDAWGNWYGRIGSSRVD